MVTLNKLMDNVLFIDLVSDVWCFN